MPEQKKKQKREHRILKLIILNIWFRSDSWVNMADAGAMSGHSWSEIIFQPLRMVHWGATSRNGMVGDSGAEIVFATEVGVPETDTGGGFQRPSLDLMSCNGYEDSK